MKNNKNIGHDTDEALAKAGSVHPKKDKHIVTEEPISEKDEVKQAEDELRNRMNQKHPKK